MIEEIWKDISGYNGKYEVSTLGRVRNKITGKVLKSKVVNPKSPYPRVGLIDDEKRNRSISVHRLVMETFNPDKKTFKSMSYEDRSKIKDTQIRICHLDGDVYNNSLSNLVWATRKYDIRAGRNMRDYNKHKKLFFTSDIHGFYDEFMKCLRDTGFDEDNEEHLLVVLGDCFDRGPSSKELFLFLNDLEKKGKCVVTHGNHDLFLEEFLEGNYESGLFNYLHNGLNETIASFVGRTAPFESWCLLDDACEMNKENFCRWVDIVRHEIMNKYPELLLWLKSRPRYFESEHYIGVHGAIDNFVEDWHYPNHHRYNLHGWDALEFDNGNFFKTKLNDGTDKTVVIGHFATRLLRRMHRSVCVNDKCVDENDVLIRDDGRVVALDATTVLTHKVNFYVVEDNVYDGKCDK